MGTTEHIPIVRSPRSVFIVSVTVLFEGQMDYFDCNDRRLTIIVTVLKAYSDCWKLRPPRLEPHYLPEHIAAIRRGGGAAGRRGAVSQVPGR